MIKKQGITVTMMVITIIILLILAGTISISVYSTLNYSRLTSWANEIMYIQNTVDERLNTSSTLTDTLETISVNVGMLTQEQKDEQFVGETITTNNSVELSILDLGKLDITDTMYGNLDTTDDVYAVSMTTGRVYYAQGFEIDDEVYFTLTEGLKQRFELTTTANLNSVVFMPSKVGYTNEPVQVTIKVPQTFSSIAISTSNENIQVSSQTVVDNLYQYTINDNLITGNYTITVSYNDGVETRTTSYEVNGYDVTAPVISEITSDNWVYKQTDTATIEYLTDITATDESGIKYIKYATGEIEDTEAKEYFAQNGNFIVNGKINLDRNLKIYTIYVEDNAGNFETLVVNTASLKGWVQEGFTVVKGDQVLEIGDVVAYDETAGGTKTGLTATEWKVLGADEQGNLLLMSTMDIKTEFVLGDETGTNLEKAQSDWLNGPSLLDTECELYGYGEGVVGKARSIRVEDVDAITGYDKTQHAIGKIWQYGNEVTYSYNGTEKPSYTSSVVSGTLETAHSNGFNYYNGEKFVVVNNLTTGTSGETFATLKSNYYYYYAPDLTTISKETNAKAYSMLFGNDDTYYWLASSSIDTYTDSVYFGVRLVEAGRVNDEGLWSSSAYSGSESVGVRAVVTLSRDITFTGDSTNGWSY